jgi:hypothetical protein
MRLTRNQIEFISYRIAKELQDKGFVEIDDPRRMVQALVSIVSRELQVEDRLNDEVREILTEHSEEMRRTNVEYREMFKMIKKKLARERKIIL